MSFVRGLRGDGWRVGVLNGGRANALTMALGNALFRIPGTSKLVFAAAERRMDAAEALLDETDMTCWHEYRLDWQADRAVFKVDGEQMLVASHPPTVPLGFVAWVDNNATTMGPGKAFSFQRIAVPQRQWMELSYLCIEKTL
jgi:hypothetical protein